MPVVGDRVGGLAGRLKRLAPLAISLLFVEVSVYLLLFVQDMSFVGAADSTADWLAAAAAGDGLDPYLDMRSLAAAYGVDYVSPAVGLVQSEAWVHPRPPGALLVLQPMTLVSLDTSFWIFAISSFLLLALLAVRFFPVASGWSWPKSLGFAALFSFSAPFLVAVQFGSWGMVFAVVLWWFWRRIRVGDDVVAGVAVGILAALKLYPMVAVLPAVLLGRSKTVAAMVLTFVTANVAGGLLFGLGIEDVVAALNSAGDVWLDLPSNGSLVPWIVRLVDITPVAAAMALAVVGCGGIWFVWRATHDVDMAMALTMVLMLLAAPLSWLSNDVLLLIPVAVLIGASSSWKVRLPLVLWMVAALISGFLSDVAGVISLLGRLVILGLLVLISLERFKPTREVVKKTAIGRRIASARSASTPI